MTQILAAESMSVEDRTVSVIESWVIRFTLRIERLRIEGRKCVPTHHFVGGTVHCVLRLAYCAQETSGCGTEGSCPKGALGQAVHCVLRIALCIAASGSMLWGGLRIAHCVCVLRIDTHSVHCAQYAIRNAQRHPKCSAAYKCASRDTPLALHTQALQYVA